MGHKFHVERCRELAESLAVQGRKERKVDSTKKKIQVPLCMLLLKNIWQLQPPELSSNLSCNPTISSF